MPDKQDEQRATERRDERPAAAAAPTVVQVESEETRRSRALAEATAEASRLKMDETAQGGGSHPGFYVVGDQKVDANGKPVQDKKD